METAAAARRKGYKEGIVRKEKTGETGEGRKEKEVCEGEEREKEETRRLVREMVRRKSRERKAKYDGKKVNGLYVGQKDMNR